MKRLVSLCTLVFSSLATPVASAQAWPARPLHAIVPVGPGSSTDIVHRLVLEQLGQQLGQPIIVENRTGAGGSIGTAFVAKAPADGYTLLANGAAHTILPAMYRTLPYDALRDFAPVVALGSTASVLVVNPARGVRSVAELVTAGKAKPHALNFSSVGVGTATHLAAERFVSAAGIDAQHIPFKGGAEAMAEVMAGRVDFFFGPVALVLPQVRDGRLLALAVNTARRSPTLPQVPTLNEAGVTDAEYPIWFALFAPAGTPRPVLERLNRDTLAAMQSPRLQGRLQDLGVDAMPMSVDEFTAYVRDQVALNAKLTRAAGVKPE